MYLPTPSRSTRSAHLGFRWEYSCLNAEHSPSSGRSDVFSPQATSTRLNLEFNTRPLFYGFFCRTDSRRWLATLSGVLAWTHLSEHPPSYAKLHVRPSTPKVGIREGWYSRRTKNIMALSSVNSHMRICFVFYSGFGLPVCANLPRPVLRKAKVPKYPRPLAEESGVQ